MSANDNDVHDKYACAELIQAWGFYRDQGKWPQLLATFVPDGQIAVSWFSGSFREFVDRCTQSFNAGQRSKHHIFPSLVRVAGERAVAETNIVILVRQKIGGALADMTSYARFLDRLEKTSGRWAIVERCAIYERDRLASCLRQATCRSTRSRTATWPRASPPPAARWRPWSIATARPRPRNCMRATRAGWRITRRVGRGARTRVAWLPKLGCARRAHAGGFIRVSPTRGHGAQLFGLQELVR